MTRFPRPNRPHHRVASASLLALVAVAPTAHAQSAPPGATPQTAVVLPPVEVVGTTPVPGTGVPKDQVPANVQTADDKRLRQSQSLNLPQFLNAQMPSVNVNETQGNPYQMDVNYRGFAASPLLGAPQGLSVFLDGVRVNEPFGDVVNWDLIPKAALAHITLLPGSNPLFGLNTLGGALSLQTKSGDTHPGTVVEVEGGSFGRISTELSHGRSLGETGHLFMAFTALNEDGWRDHSPSRIRQAFVKGGQHTSDFSWDLGLSAADNRLIGNGLLPESMLEQRREQVYTRPDQSENQMTLLSFNTNARLAEQWELGATVYARRNKVATVNGDVNDGYDPPAVTEGGVENRTATKSDSQGIALQTTWTPASHRVTFGASYDRSTNHFKQSEAEGDLDGTRAVVPLEEAETSAQISGKSRTASVYIADVFSVLPTLQLTVSGRYNDTRVSTVDEGRIDLGLPTALDGEGTYRKFNPAIGATWQITPALTAFGGWSQGNRAPSPIELGCSDPAHACVLPNALQSDPPLNQVVSRTFEAGLRGSLGQGLRWSASAFRTVNDDDLLFISNGLAAGYFSNFGRTQRQGLELSLSQQTGAFTWAAAYSYLRATFESSACIVAEGNSTAETSAACAGDGEIEVKPGDKLPGLPAHTFKLSLDFRAAPAWNVGAQLRAQSKQYVRGNENNAHQADGVDFQGAGTVPGFAVLDLTTSWRPAARWEVFAKVSNVFDRRYSTGGMLGHNAFDANGALQAPADWRQEQFVAPGAPRAGWVGVRLEFGGAEL
ncbi:TonB-dependent receptor [Sphaerotilaceae bacterium SBD11-9]